MINIFVNFYSFYYIYDLIFYIFISKSHIIKKYNIIIDILFVYSVKQFWFKLVYIFDIVEFFTEIRIKLFNQEKKIERHYIFISFFYLFCRIV